MSSVFKALRPWVSRSPFLTRTYRRWREMRDLGREPAMTPMGFRFNGNAAMAAGTFEPVETALARRILAESSVLINIGANVGYYCGIALAMGRHVVAFEPMRTNLFYLLRNVRANGWDDNFECFPLALADRAGLIEIFGGGTSASLVEGWAGQTDGVLVPASTLDIVLGDRFADSAPFVILDVEGAEFSTLKGARRLLGAEPKPIWMVEITVLEHQPRGVDVNPRLIETFKLFLDQGYEALTVEDRPRRMTLADVEAIARARRHDLQTTNFVFVDPAKAHLVGGRAAGAPLAPG